MVELWIGILLNQDQRVNGKSRTIGMPLGLQSQNGITYLARLFRTSR